MLKRALFFFSFLVILSDVLPQSKGMQLLQEGIQFYQQNKGQEAVNKLTEAGSELKKSEDWGNYATCQCGLANILSGYQLYDRANKVLDETFPVIQKNLQPNDTRLATCYLNKGMVEVNQRNNTSALKFFHKGLSARKAVHPANSNECLEVVSLLSKVHIDLNYPDSALYYSGLIEKELLNRGQGQALSMADVYNTMGNAYDLKKDYTNAIQFHAKGLNIREKVSGENSSEVAYSLGNVSLAYESNGDFENAEKTGLKSYEIRKKLFGPDDEQTQLSVFNLASLYSEMGEWKKAMQFYELQKKYTEKLNLKAATAEYKLNYGSAQVLSELNISQGILNIKEAASWYALSNEQSKDRLATCYQNLTLAYTSYGDWDMALDYNGKSAAIKKQMGTLDPESELNAGNIYFYQGNNIKAIHAYTQALGLYEKKYGYGHYKHITAIKNIAHVSAKINATAAKQVYQTLLALYKNDEEKQAGVYTDIGSVYLQYSQFDSALFFYNKARGIYKKKSNTSELTNLRSLEGVVAMGQKRYGEAETIFAEVAGLNEKQPNSYFQCKTYSNLALVQLEQKFYDKSEQSANKALTCNRNESGQIKFSDEYLRTRKILFRSKAKSALNTKGLKELKAALAIFEEISKSSSGKNSADEMTVKTGAGNDTYKLNVLAIQLCQSLFQLSGEKMYMDLAAEITEDCKSVVIKNALKDINFKKLSGVPQDLIIAERKTLEQYEQYALSLNTENVSEEEEKRFATKLAELYQQEDSIKKLIKLKYPKYDQLKNAPRSGIGDIQKKLGSDEAIINYIFNRDFAAAIVISNKNIGLVELKNISASEAAILAYREGIDKNDYKTISENGFSLYKNVFSSVDSILTKLQVKKITIIPDGSLFFFPFESLVRTAPKATDNFSTLQYVVKTYDINYLYAASLILTNDQSKSTASKDYIGIAPVFADHNEVAKTRSVSFKPDMFGKKKRSFLSDGTYINPLPGTLAEVDQVSNYLINKGQKCTILKFDLANEKSVKAANLLDYKYIHFATHGFVNENQPNYSGLILAQNGDTEDNILFASEIYNLTLNADLVALSACQTGLGTVSEGEGLIGLSRGFMYAGAKNLLVSLWPVSDEGTSTLMVDFFSSFENSTYTDALRKSKLKLIADPALASPFYWAPFILIGK
ncbi:MAG: CHAT domain-containing protein [Bacteroidetes bacterium]|nr:CHAT domain-containing protein [Bacteroidota bacterium]